MYGKLLRLRYTIFIVDQVTMFSCGQSAGKLSKMRDRFTGGGPYSGEGWDNQRELERLSSERERCALQLRELRRKKEAGESVNLEALSSLENEIARIDSEMKRTNGDEEE